MANVLISVGGSGQHTALAYLRLARLCNFEPARLMTVDSDLRQGGSADQQTTASQLERQAYVGFRQKAYWEPVRPMPEVTDPRVQTFEALLGPAPGFERELAEAFFRPAQRDVRITTGFHGHPAVAASTFRLFLGQDDGASRFSKLFEWLEPQGEHRVVLAGSTFGGTGSGVMPVLAAHLRRWAQERGLNLRLGGVIQVRWFDLGLPDQGSDTKDVTSNDLERNSSCLVEYYQSNLGNLFDNGCLVGHEPHANRRSTGVDRQPEHPHAVNLLAGCVAYQLLHGDTFADSRGLLGVASPDGELANHLMLPFGMRDAKRPRVPASLATHVRATSAQIALGRAVLNLLAAGPPSPLEVIEPYPRFITDLVRAGGGSWGGTDADHVEPASTWRALLEQQEEAMRWLARVRDRSHDVGACQFPEDLVPPFKDIGRMDVHEKALPGRLDRVLRRVVAKVRPAGFDEDVVRRSFYGVRDHLEALIEREDRR